MTIHLDTSALVGALAGLRDAFDRLRTLVDEGHRVRLSTIVLYEWLRGPRTATELRVPADLFPRDQAVPFDAEAAVQAAALYARLPRPRGRNLDLAIAACALVGDASLWTLNADDFDDVPGLRLAQVVCAQHGADAWHDWLCGNRSRRRRLPGSSLRRSTARTPGGLVGRPPEPKATMGGRGARIFRDCRRDGAAVCAIPR